MLKHLASKLLLAVTIGHGVPLRYAIPVYVSGQFDSATTHYTLNHCRGCYELNPLLKPFARSNSVYPAIAIGDSSYLYLYSRYHKHHKWIARAIVIGGIALHIYCGINNIKVVNNARH